MSELVGFQTMVILDPYGITFNAVGVFGLYFQFLFKSDSSYCGCITYQITSFVESVYSIKFNLKPEIIWETFVEGTELMQ